MNGFVHRPSVNSGVFRGIRDEPVGDFPRNTAKARDHDATMVRKRKKQYIRANCIPIKGNPAPDTLEFVRAELTWSGSGDDPADRRWVWHHLLQKTQAGVPARII